MDKLIIQTSRTGYATSQIDKTMTVEELIWQLREYELDTPVYLAFDGGYTYGGLRPSYFEIEED